MLSKLAYLTLCHSIQLLAPLARSDPAKDLELMVLRQQARAHRPRPHGGNQPGATAIPLVLLPGQAGDITPLAPSHGRRILGLPVSRPRATTAGR